jgi:predicted ArsR family transcriptional regulator
MQAMASLQHRHRVLAGLTRSRLLAVLRQADGPLGVRELTETVGLHPNSVREQLDQLVDAGLVARSIAPPAGRGRPGLRYVVESKDGDPDPNAYRELARVLADELARQPEPAATATGAGERWGRTMVANVAPTPTATEAVDRLVMLLDDAGFAPERPAGTGDPIRLRHCPFGPLAREHPAVVCGVHLGLMRGALRELGAPLDAIRLEPFVAPDLCIAHLGPRETAADG